MSESLSRAFKLPSHYDPSPRRLPSQCREVQGPASWQLPDVPAWPEVLAGHLRLWELKLDYWRDQWGLEGHSFMSLGLWADWWRRHITYTHTHTHVTRACYTHTWHGHVTHTWHGPITCDTGMLHTCDMGLLLTHTGDMGMSHTHDMSMLHVWHGHVAHICHGPVTHVTWACYTHMPWACYLHTCDTCMLHDTGLLHIHDMGLLLTHTHTPGGMRRNHGQQDLGCHSVPVFVHGCKACLKTNGFTPEERVGRTEQWPHWGVALFCRQERAGPHIIWRNLPAPFWKVGVSSILILKITF